MENLPRHERVRLASVERRNKLKSLKAALERAGKRQERMKFSFNKEWYQSSRLRVVVVAAALLVANDMFGLGLSEAVVEKVAEIALAYVVGKSIQDAASSYAEVRGEKAKELAASLPPQPVRD